MKTFIVSTFAGYTEDENGHDCENLQILEYHLEAVSKDDALNIAFENWKNDFPSIDEYRVDEVIISD